MSNVSCPDFCEDYKLTQLGIIEKRMSRVRKAVIYSRP